MKVLLRANLHQREEERDSWRDRCGELDVFAVDSCSEERFMHAKMIDSEISLNHLGSIIIKGHWCMQVYLRLQRVLGYNTDGLIAGK